MYVLDTVRSEQEASTAAVSIALDRELNCCGVVQSRGGTVSAGELPIVLEVNNNFFCCYRSIALLISFHDSEMQQSYQQHLCTDGPVL